MTVDCHDMTASFPAGRGGHFADAPSRSNLAECTRKRIDLRQVIKPLRRDNVRMPPYLGGLAQLRTRHIGKRFQYFLEALAKLVCLVRAISPWGGLIHIGGLREFHLDCVDAFLRLTVVTRCPAAFKTPVEDAVIGLGVLANSSDGLLNVWRTAGPAIGADVEVRKDAFEQIRYPGAD